MVSVEEIRKITPIYIGVIVVGILWICPMGMFTRFLYSHIKTQIPSKCPLPSYLTYHQHGPDMSHLTRRNSLQ